MKYAAIVTVAVQALLLWYDVVLLRRARASGGFTSIGEDVIAYYYVLSLLGCSFGVWMLKRKEGMRVLAVLVTALSSIAFLTFLYLHLSGMVGRWEKAP